ncbi:invasion associated locus B family protein [Ensifer aridi]|uniref:invasion associated locus B family protein n=1 Tax=Ensifer aridi TaxID=1708715 RepID=UPI000614D7C6|nr:invasion associated locus B family protein [Ensifer aridi]
MRHRAGEARFILVAAACLLLTGGSPVAGQEAVFYRVKPSEVVPPQGVPLGSYRRILHPFENWNLICDENLKAKQKVCNISQSFIDQNQALVFSWSLAADDKGKPFMILRAPAQLGTGSKISLGIAGRERPVDVELTACDSTVCVGYLPVGPILRQQIGKEATVNVSYSPPSGAAVSLDAPFKGLKSALSAIN